MKEIELYKAVRFTKDFDTDSCPPTHIRKGTGGHVVDIIVDKKTKETVYIIDLFSEDYEGGGVDVFHRDQIERAEEWD